MEDKSNQKSGKRRLIDGAKFLARDSVTGKFSIPAVREVTIVGKGRRVTIKGARVIEAASSTMLSKPTNSGGRVGRSNKPVKTAPPPVEKRALPVRAKADPRSFAKELLVTDKIIMDYLAK